MPISTTMDDTKKVPSNKALLEQLLSLSVQIALDRNLAGQGFLTAKFKEAVKAGLDPFNIWEIALLHSADEVGRLFKNNEIHVPEVLVWANELRAIRDLTREICGSVAVKHPDVLIIMAVVKGDLHDIGKNLVIMMAEAHGFNVRDLGKDVAPWEIVEAIKGADARLVVVGLSALLTTTMPRIEDTIAAIQKADLRTKAKVVVGGAPVTQAYADKVGADGYGDTASDAIKIFKKLALIIKGEQ